jgi:hypothetical protein
MGTPSARSDIEREPSLVSQAEYEAITELVEIKHMDELVKLLLYGAHGGTPWPLFPTKKIAANQHICSK